MKIIQLRSTESGWNNIGKLDIVFRMGVVNCSCITYLDIKNQFYFLKIAEVLELNFHWVTVKPGLWALDWTETTITYYELYCTL